MMCQEFSTFFQCPSPIVTSLVVMCAACWANQVVHIPFADFWLFFSRFILPQKSMSTPRKGALPADDPHLDQIQALFQPLYRGGAPVRYGKTGYVPPTGHNGCRWFARLANPEDWWKEGWWWCSTGSFGCIEVTWIYNFFGKSLGRQCFFGGLLVVWVPGNDPGISRNVFFSFIYFIERFTSLLFYILVIYWKGIEATVNLYDFSLIPKAEIFSYRGFY